jgi:imidazolonepropionase-like amidohydrolase
MLRSQTYESIEGRKDCVYLKLGLSCPTASAVHFLSSGLVVVSDGKIQSIGGQAIAPGASGGVLSPTDDVDVPQLSQAELNALVDEAHTLRRKTAAHAHGAEAAKRAVRAGVDSIEYGTFLDDEALRMMRDKAAEFGYMAADGMTPAQ